MSDGAFAYRSRFYRFHFGSKFFSNYVLTNQSVPKRGISSTEQSHVSSTPYVGGETGGYMLVLNGGIAQWRHQYAL